VRIENKDAEEGTSIIWNCDERTFFFFGDILHQRLANFAKEKYKDLIDTVRLLQAESWSL